MVHAVSSIATHVFKESVRDKVFYNLVMFAVLLIAVSYLLADLSAGQDVKIVKDLGLAAMAAIGLFIAVFIGIGMVYKEVERRSIYSLLAKPVRRSEVILGKYVGLLFTLAVNVAIMTVALYVVLAVLVWVQPAEVQRAWETPALDPRMSQAILLIVAELMLVTAIALFFSTFATPIVSAVVTFGLYVVGHFSADLRNFEHIVDSTMGVYVAKALYYLLPNLAAFDVKAAVVHGQSVAWGYVALTIAYAVAYSAALVLASVVIFSRQDLK